MLKARKRFGQNFLTDPNTINRIISAIRPGADDRILEIGPGHGAITESLLASKADLTVVEIDRDLVAELGARFPDLAIVESDILKADLDGLIQPGTRVVGNLPYNISTPLLFRLFEHVTRIHDMHFMLQLEVVDRLTASPSTSDYGRLTVMASCFCHAEKLFEVPPGAFTPRPKVTSAIVRLTPARHGLVVDDVALLEQLVTRVFSQRRKTIRNGFKGILSADELTDLGIDPSLRPENLDLSDFIACANAAAGKSQ